MEIEIFRDNLNKTETKKNRLNKYHRLIIESDGLVFILSRKTDGLLLFPEINTGKLPAGLSPTLIIREYREGLTEETEYYFDTLKALLPKTPSGYREKWMEPADILSTLEDYRGPDPIGAEAEEREFIALANSI